MAAHLEDITAMIGKQIPGTQLILLADNGKDATRHRMVKTQCMLCGEIGRQRLSNLRSSDPVQSGGCLKKATYVAYHTKKVEGLSKEQSEGIYVAMITGELDGQHIIGTSTRAAIAERFGVDVAMVDFTFRAFKNKVESLAVQIYNAAQKVTGKIDKLASRFNLPAVAIRQAISSFHKVVQAAQQAAQEAQATSDRILEMIYWDMRCAVAAGKENRNRVLSRTQLQRNGKSDYGWAAECDAEISLYQYPVQYRARWVFTSLP